MDIRQDAGPRGPTQLPRSDFAAEGAEGDVATPGLGAGVPDLIKATRQASAAPYHPLGGCYKSPSPIGSRGRGEGIHKGEDR